MDIELLILDPEISNPNKRDNKIVELLVILYLIKYNHKKTINYRISQLIIKDTIDEQIFNKQIIFY